MSSHADDFVTWTQALEARHRAVLTFPEVRRGLQALSANYVQRRLAPPSQSKPSRGKRAAFALYYAPMHYCIVAHVVASWRLATPAVVHDWGCGTGVGAAAWAKTGGQATRLVGCDQDAWALAEARWNWRQLGLSGQLVRGSLLDRPVPRSSYGGVSSSADAGGSCGIVLAFSVNELTDPARDRLLTTLRQAACQGCSILVVEPIARRICPWWAQWSTTFVGLGGGAREHKFLSPMPASLALYAKAAKLDHRLLTARSLVLAPAGHAG